MKSTFKKRKRITLGCCVMCTFQTHNPPNAYDSYLEKTKRDFFFFERNYAKLWLLNQKKGMNSIS